MQKLYSVFIIMLLVSCSSSKNTGSSKLPGYWQAQPITIDGDSKDWPSPYPTYDAKAMIGYAVSNDKNYLYLTMETGDERTQMKLLKAGMTVWIDTSGKKNQSVGINFPLQNTEPNMKQEIDMQPRGGGPGTGNMFQNNRRALEAARELSLEGFKGCGGGFLAMQNNGCGITVRMGIDEFHELVWEAAIPFKAFYSKAQLDKKDEGKAISVCFAIKGFKKPETKKDAGGGNEGMGGRSQAGMGSGRQGGMGGGISSPGAERNQMFETTKTWKQFGLAYKE